MSITEIKQKCVSKLKKTSNRIKDTIPYTTKNGKYDDLTYENISWWTNSFWAGILWELYKETTDETYAEYAVSIEKRLEKVLYEYEVLDHDLGFLWLLSGVEHFELKNDKKALNDSLLAASVLASRYDLSAKIIRAWNGEGGEGLAIIDCMMNLPLLYWASEKTNDERFKKVAMSHADTVLKEFIRENGSSNHMVRFDTKTGRVLERYGGQGYKKGSSWTRGQGWAIYGFIQSYQHTKEVRYLETAKKVADYFLQEAAKNNYKVKCDFCQPIDDKLYDSSAAAIAACGMTEIYKETNDKKYLDGAINLVEAINENFCPWDDENDEALINFGCEMYSKFKHLALIYGDYYFFKAVLELDKIVK